MHDSKSAVSVQNLIATLAGTFRTAFSRDLEILQSRASEQSSGSLWTWISTHHTAFWSLIALEWKDYDAHRINKYLLLVRLVVREVFGIVLSPVVNAAEGEILSDRARQDLTATQVEILEKLPLSARERKVPDGLRLHVLDVWGEELRRAMEERSKAKEAVEALMVPVRTLAKEALGKGVRMRARDVVGEFDGERE